MWLRVKKIRRTTLLCVGLTLFLIGIAIVRLRQPLVFYICLIGSVVVLSLPAKIRHKFSALYIVFFVVCLGLGIWQGLSYLQKTDLYKQLYRKAVIMEVTAKEDAVYSERKQIIFSANNIRVQKPFQQKLVGNIEVEGFGVPMVYRGDRIRIEGKLFPKRGENIAGVSFAKMTLIQKENSPIDNIRRKFAVGLQNVLPEPLASLSLGILIGQRNTLPVYLTEQLVIVGLVHIVAVSGYNLTIITNFSKRLLQKRSRYQAFIGSLILIGLFLLLTGSSPSIVRAAVVSGVGLAMWYYGRNIKSVLLILLAAVITAGLNPLNLWSSIGWYLSFTAFFGVLVLAPLFRKRFLPIQYKDKLFPQLLTETLAAQICTLPLILFIFGRLSIVSILANVLVVPLVPVAMLTSLVAGIWGMIGLKLFSVIIAFPARFLLEYIIGVTDLMSRISFASMSLKINALQMIFMYIVIILMCVLIWKKSDKSAILTDKKQEVINGRS